MTTAADTTATKGAEKSSGKSERPIASPRRPGARDPAAGYRRIAWSLISLVLVPSGLILAVGLLLLVRGSPDWNLVLGILVLVFCGTLATGVTLVWVFIYKETNLSQLQTDFVSKVSHELKTPLTSIRMFAETLKMKRGSPEQAEECIDLLCRETERLAERIDRLLEWGRMEAGRKIYDLRPTNVGEAVREAIDHFSPLQLQADGEVDVAVAPEIPEVMMDRPAFVTAVTNLLSNAWKYGGRPRQIDVRVERGDDEKTVRVKVHDNGEGIPPSEHKQIFQKFYRRDDRLSRMQEGSGLGLAIAAHVVRGHRGKIVVESAPGKGATFVITLPVA
jgi:two-component system phosphate regulon sensor histidine kinase PhoR